MITDVVASYVALRRAMGFDYKTGAYLLDLFARFAAKRGDAHVRVATAVEWAAQAPSAQQKERRLQAVIALARHAHVEDSRHEIPSAGTFAGNTRRRPTPFIFSQGQIGTLLAGTQRLGTRGAYRPLLYQTLFGLLATTGMRVSEALALRRRDLSVDGIVIRKTKFRKSRLLPVHDSTARAIEQYMVARRRFVGDHVFDSGHGKPLRYPLVSYTFQRLLHVSGLESTIRTRPRPHIHSLRHTFAVRALEGCPTDRAKVDRHVLALTTYLGHAHVSCTYWYLQATPQLMNGIARQVEASFFGDAR